jgi:hypothetical protein
MSKVVKYTFNRAIFTIQYKLTLLRLILPIYSVSLRLKASFFRVWPFSWSFSVIVCRGLAYVRSTGPPFFSLWGVIACFCLLGRAVFLSSPLAFSPDHNDTYVIFHDFPAMLSTVISHSPSHQATTQRILCELSEACRKIPVARSPRPPSGPLRSSPVGRPSLRWKP